MLDARGAGRRHAVNGLRAMKKPVSLQKEEPRGGFVVEQIEINVEPAASSGGAAAERFKVTCEEWIVEVFGGGGDFEAGAADGPLAFELIEADVNALIEEAFEGGFDAVAEERGVERKRSRPEASLQSFCASCNMELSSGGLLTAKTGRYQTRMIPSRSCTSRMSFT